MFFSPKYWIVAIIIAAVITLLMKTYVAEAEINREQEAQNKVELQVSNPYRLQMNLEVKCDWDRDMEQYMLHKKIEIPAKKITIIRLPNNLKKCEVWPQIKFLTQ